MSGISKKLMGTTAAGGEALAIEDVFSTYLYTGNATAQTITNGIDLAGEGGLVWVKSRSNTSFHALVDTERGAFNTLSTNDTSGELSPSSVTSFNSDGFALGSSGDVNEGSWTYASWTFRKAPRFFDVVTWTGTGAARTIAHNLGIAPGCIVVKATSFSGDWWVYHRSLGATQRIPLNATNASAANVNPWNNTEPTEAEFSLSSGVAGNESGIQYVAYLFAHDPLGPSGDGSDGLIACGGYTGNGADDGPTISLGWEPQWLLIKRSAGGTGEWILVDTMRGMTADGSVAFLEPNTSDAEVNNNYVRPTADGFKLTATGSVVNASGSDYIYIAIRRGPMRAPESGTEVFNTGLYTGNGTNNRVLSSPITSDAVFSFYRGSGFGKYVYDRIRGNERWIDTTATSAESNSLGGSTGRGYSLTEHQKDLQLGLDDANWFNINGDTYGFYNFRRAPEFFDVVAYTGTGINGLTLNHNLDAVPEMILVRHRNVSYTPTPWFVYHSALGNTKYLHLNTTAAEATSQFAWNNTSPTDANFTVGAFDGVNGSSGFNYIAYLFATLPGVSKVGSYTGSFPTSTTQTIDCGFATSARFVLIKAASRSGAWAVWDSARGITVSDDPRLELNSTGAEQTQSNIDVEPHSSGFIIDSSSGEFNEEGETYIFYAIA
jgi:hypothetical protein